MPAKIELPDDLHQRLLAMNAVVEVVLDEEVSLDLCAQTVLVRGLDAMLADLIGAAAPEILLTSFQQLAAGHPNEIYGYVAEVLKTGAAVQHEEAKRRVLGFGPPSECE